MNRNAIKAELRKLRSISPRIQKLLRDEARGLRFEAENRKAGRPSADCTTEYTVNAIRMEVNSLMFRVNGLQRALRSGEK